MPYEGWAKIDLISPLTTAFTGVPVAAEKSAPECATAQCGPVVPNDPVAGAPSIGAITGKGSFFDFAKAFANRLAFLDPAAGTAAGFGAGER